MRRQCYPPTILQALESFQPVARTLAAASGVELDDARQEFAIAILVGDYPARSVPRSRRIRKTGGKWRLTDAASAATSLDDSGFAAEAPEKALLDDLSGISRALAGGKECGATRCCVGRRSAQLAGFEAGRDFFGEME